MLTRPWPPINFTDRDPLLVNPYSMSASDSFAPIPPPVGSVRITEAGDIRITESGDRRITE